jgi:hypothetical protein
MCSLPNLTAGVRWLSRRASARQPKLDIVRDRAVASVKVDADRLAKNLAPISEKFSRAA